MEKQDLFNQKDGDTMPTPLADGSKSGTEENTGLFDIRTLANVTKKRLSERQDSIEHVEQSLLSSASRSFTTIPVTGDSGSFSSSSFGSGSLSSVQVPPFEQSARGTPAPEFVPQAEGSVDTPITADAAGAVVAVRDTEIISSTPAPTAPVAAAASMTFGATIAVKKPTPLWVYVVALAVVAGGVAGFLIYKNKAADTSMAAGVPMDEEATDDSAAEVAPKVEPLVEPTEPVVEPVPEEVTAVVADDETTGVVDEDVDDDEKADSKAKKDKKDRGNYKRAKKDTPTESDADALRAAIDKRKVKKAKADGMPAVDTSDAKKDLNELLDSAAVGTVLGKAKVEAKPKKPAKTDLNRADVKSSIRKITGKAKGCYHLFEKAGSVKIRFTVAATGKVTKASALGKFAGTDTGKCVAKAVKRAKFPAWDGAPKTIKYPFLLSP